MKLDNDAGQCTFYLSEYVRVFEEIHLICLFAEIETLLFARDTGTRLDGFLLAATELNEGLRHEFEGAGDGRAVVQLVVQALLRQRVLHHSHQLCQTVSLNPVPDSQTTNGTVHAYTIEICVYW